MYQACHNLLLPVCPVVSATKAIKSTENVKGSLKMNGFHWAEATHLITQETNLNQMPMEAICNMDLLPLVTNLEIRPLKPILSLEHWPWKTNLNLVHAFQVLSLIVSHTRDHTQASTPQFSAWNTHSGDINVYQTALPPLTPSAFHSTPCMPASNSAFRLWFRSGNIRVGKGCRNRFDKLAKSPYNLCVQHEKWWLYTSPVTHLPESRFGNAYYHAHPQCIQLKWSNFRPTDLQVPDELKCHLTTAHKELIQSVWTPPVTFFTVASNYLPLWF